METEGRFKKKVQHERAKSAHTYHQLLSKKEIESCGGDIQTIMTINKSMNLSARRNFDKSTRTQRYRASMAGPTGATFITAQTTELGKMKSTTIDNGESQMTSNLGEKEEGTPRRKTFDDYAVTSFMENPDMYKRKIAEFHKAREDHLQEKLENIDSKLMQAAIVKEQLERERINEMKLHNGDPAKVHKAKEELNQRDRYKSLSSYVELSHKMAK